MQLEIDGIMNGCSNHRQCQTMIVSVDALDIFFNKFPNEPDGKKLVIKNWKIVT